MNMSTATERSEASLLTRMLTKTAKAGFLRAYEQIRVDESKYMRHLQRAHRLPINSWDDTFRLGPRVLDPIAQ